MAWRKSARGWAFVLAAVSLGVAGCKEEGDTFLLGGGGGSIPPGDFPSVRQWWNEHNLASDDRALSEPGHDVDQVRDFANEREPGTGIVLATSADRTNLFASFHDGESFTPLVEVRGENQDDGAPVDLETTSVVFLNDVPGRDGDAMVLFRREGMGTALDANGNGIPENDANTRLYSFYFDVSQHRDAVSEADDGALLLYGFTSLATFVDSDPNGNDEDPDADVETTGLVSDGLCYSAEFDGEGNRHRSGDPTSFVYAVWVQQDDTGDGAPDTGQRVWFNRFDLGGTTTRFDPAGGETLDAPGLEDEDDAGGSLIVHNGLLLWTATTDAADATDNDEPLHANVFDAAGPSATIRLSRTDEDPSDVVRTSGRSAEDLYGDDHGLPRFYFFYFEEGYDDGNVSAEPDVMVAALDLDGTDSEVEEIDEFVEGTGVDVAPVELSSLSTAMGRGGEVVFVAWRQDHLSPEESGGGELPTVSVFVRGLDTRVTSSAADALTGDVSQNHTATRLNADVRDAPEEIDRNVLSFEFQEGLADGTSSPNAALQSNRHRVSVLFEQALADVSGTTPASSDRIALHVAHVELDRSLTAPDFTSSSGMASDTQVDTVDQNWFSFNSSTLLQTAGGASAVDDGDGGVLVFYLNQGNHRDDAFAPGRGGEPTIVPAVQLEIPLSAAGAPSFQVGEVIALARIENHLVVSNEPNCPVDHVHSLEHPTLGRAILIDGQGPYAEPTDRQLTCGYGPTVQLEIPPPPDADPSAAFVETRLFVWFDGETVEISSDGSQFGSPDHFQVEDFEVVATPIDPDVQNNPDHGGDTLQIVIREHNSNRGSVLKANGGSPLVLRARTYDKTSTDPDLRNRFDPPLDRFPERVDTGQPSHVSDVVSQTDGDTVALYFLSNGRLYYNENDGQGWRTTADGLPDPAVVDHDSGRPVESFLVGDSRLCSGDSTLAGTPVLWTKRDPDAFSPRRLKARIHR